MHTPHYAEHAELEHGLYKLIKRMAINAPNNATKRKRMHGTASTPPATRTVRVEAENVPAINTN